MECLICFNEFFTSPHGVIQEALCKYFCNLLSLSESKFLNEIKQSGFCHDCWEKLEEVSSLVTQLFQIEKNVKELLMTSRERTSSRIPIYRDDNGIKNEISNSVLRNAICEEFSIGNEMETQFSLSNFQSSHEDTTKIFNDMMEEDTIDPLQLCTSSQISDVEDPLLLDIKVENEDYPIPFNNEIENSEDHEFVRESKVDMKPVKSENCRLRLRTPKSTKKPEETNLAESKKSNYELRRRDPDVIELPKETIDSYISSLLHKKPGRATKRSSQPIASVASTSKVQKLRPRKDDDLHSDPTYKPGSIVETPNRNDKSNKFNFNFTSNDFDPEVKVVIYTGTVEDKKHTKVQGKMMKERENLIWTLHSKGIRVEDIGKMLGMSANAVYNHIKKLGEQKEKSKEEKPNESKVNLKVNRIKKIK